MYELLTIWKDIRESYVAVAVVAAATVAEQYSSRSCARYDISTYMNKRRQTITTMIAHTTFTPTHPFTNTHTKKHISLNS